MKSIIVSLNVINKSHQVTVFMLLMKRDVPYTVCQSLRGVFVNRMKTIEI